jgi:hypothetical protein
MPTIPGHIHWKHQSPGSACHSKYQLAQGKHSASLDDYRTIREKEKVHFPKDILEVGVLLSRYAVLCQTLFQGTGHNNPLVETLWALAASINNLVTFIAERYQQVARIPAVSHL